MNADELAVCKAKSACQDTVYTHAYGTVPAVCTCARARADNIKLHSVDIPPEERRDEGCEGVKKVVLARRRKRKKKSIYTKKRCKK